MTRSIVLAATVTCVLASGATLAHADRRIAVMPFEGGAKARAMWAQVIDMVLDENTLVPAEDAGAADGVVTGALSRNGARYQLVIRLTETSTTTVLKRFELKLRRPRLRSKWRRKLRARLGAAIENLAPLDDAPEAFSEEHPLIEEAPVEKVDAATESAAVARGASSGPARWDAGVAASLTAGMGVTTRALSFEAADDHPEYSGALAPSVRLEGEVFFESLGVTGVAERSVGLASASADPAMADVELPTRYSRLAVAAVYQRAVGTFSGEPIRARAGLAAGRTEFSIDRSGAAAGAAVDVPNVTYAYVAPRLSVSVPATPRVSIDASAEFLLVFDAGEIVDTDFYGPARTLGANGELRLTWRLHPAWVAAVGARVSAVQMSFVGDGARSQDGPVSALDLYLGGHASAGYVF